MNNIKQILDAIEALGGSASIEDVTKYLCKKNKIMYDGFLKTIVLSTLKKYEELVSYSDTTRKWSSNAIKNKYLFVSDNKAFKTMVDVLNTVFGFNRKPKGAWEALYDSPDGNYIFFARKHPKSKWTNSFSADESEYEMHPPIKPDVIEEKEIDQKLYYIFTDIGNRGVYLFKGVYKQIENNNNGSKYIRVDDRVLIRGKTVDTSGINPILICNITYMKYYNGITDEDQIVGGGGSYPNANNDCGEKFNFHICPDGKVRGFVETLYIGGKEHMGDFNYAKDMIIEKIDPSFKDKDIADGVRVVFISKGPNNERNVVVGWYDNAKVYRKRQMSSEQFGFNLECDSNDAHLIDEGSRTFEYPKKNDDGTYNFGQSNVSYPVSMKQEKTTELVRKLNEYLNELL